jgi:phenylacetate-CoA ligase
MVNILDVLTNYKDQISIYKNLKKINKYDKKKLDELQFNQLSKLLNHSYKNVPYYTKLFNKLKIKPNDIKSIKDLQKLPFLTREIVQKKKIKLKAINYPKKKFELKKTGGTTGDPLSFYIEKGIWIAYHIAYNRIFMDRAGYKRRNKTISILGINKESIYHPIFRTIEISSFYLMDNPKKYIKKIINFKPKYIISYPSAIAFLSKFIIENKLEKIKNLKGIFCHGEPLYSWEINIIKNAFKCSVFDIYGHGEKSVIAATCGESNNYHIFSDYCIVELIDKNGKIINEEEQIGELVVTGLKSHIFPFIRYKTGDLGIYSLKKCECGIEYPIIKSIIGRINEYLITKKGRLIHLIDINQFIAENSLYIKKWQLIQEKEGYISLLIIVDDKFTNKNLNKLNTNFNNKYSDDFNLNIKIVDKIIQTGSAKHHFLIQKLPIEKMYNKIKLDG